jgi:5-methylcytosine-specific restriction endonuclease McrA
VLLPFRDLLWDVQAGRCFYCEKPIRAAAPAVDHFIPWSRYPMDLGQNLVLADERCNGWKSDRLAGHEHLAHWRERNARADLAPR